MWTIYYPTLCDTDMEEVEYLTKSEENKIEGVWLSEVGHMKVEVYEKEGYHYGKVVWLEEPNDSNGDPLKDVNNPDRSLRDRPVMGLDMLQKLYFKNDRWYGSLYTPNRGLMMDVEIEMGSEDEMILEVKYGRFTKQRAWKRSSL